MMKQLPFHGINKSYKADNSKASFVFRLNPVSRTIRNIFVLSGLAISSSGSWAETQINPNQIWLNSGGFLGACAKDFDQDGDMDLFEIHSSVVNLIENTGTPQSPKFSSP